MTTNLKSHATHRSPDGHGRPPSPFTTNPPASPRTLPPARSLPTPQDHHTSASSAPSHPVRPAVAITRVCPRHLIALERLPVPLQLEPSRIPGRYSQDALSLGHGTCSNAAGPHPSYTLTPQEAPPTSTTPTSRCDVNYHACMHARLLNCALSR